MHGIVLDVMNVLMGRPIVDTIADVVADVPWWESSTKTVFGILINFLVIPMVRSMNSATSTNTPTTTVVDATTTIVVVENTVISVDVISFSGIDQR